MLCIGVLKSSQAKADPDCSFIRYFNFLLDMRQRMCKDLFTWNQLQEGIDSVNNTVEDEYERMKHTHIYLPSFSINIYLSILGHQLLH